MSVRALFWALEQDIPPRDKLVLIIVANYYNDDTESAWMKQGTLAVKTGFNRTTIVHSLHALEHQHQLISSEQRRYADGRNATKVYRLHVDQSNTVKPSVDQRNTDSVDLLNTDSVDQRNNKNLKHRTNNIEPKTYVPFEDYRQAWNTHAGPLPKVTTLNAKRKRAITQHHKQNTNALQLFTQAVKTVALEDWWIQNAYGFDNLFTGNKILTYAEKHQAQQTRTRTPVTLDF